MRSGRVMLRSWKGASKRLMFPLIMREEMDGRQDVNLFLRYIKYVIQCIFEVEAKLIPCATPFIQSLTRTETAPLDLRWVESGVKCTPVALAPTKSCPLLPFS